MSESRDVDVISHQETVISNKDVTMGFFLEEGRCSNQGVMEFFELLQQGDAQTQLIEFAILDDLCSCI